jgi:peptide/nickel transport system permease protein
MDHPKQADPYWISVWKKLRQHKLGMFSMYVLILFCLVGIYAPFLASSKPLAVFYNGTWYFPLFRYLFYSGFFTKPLDIFFNLFIFTFPLGLLIYFTCRNQRKVCFWALLALAFAHCALFITFISGKGQDPASSSALNRQRYEALKTHPQPDWNFDLKYMTDYAKLNLVLRYQLRKAQHERLLKYSQAFFEHENGDRLIPGIPTLWQMDLHNENLEIARNQALLSKLAEDPEKNAKAIAEAKAKIKYIQQKRQWLEEQSAKMTFKLMPLLRGFHWEDDAGGEQSFNRHISWWELTRINRKDLMAALIFGVRISLVVGILSVILALAIGLPIGALAGFYGGNFDIFVSRVLEIWESMPIFFMLLLVVAVTQSKSILLIIAVIGLFGWTGISRYIRGEFFKQRNLSYVEACRALGFSDSHIIFSHIMPNAIPPVLTLLPFAIMGAITSEAGLSFLGLGEEGSTSWGVLMDEGRQAFPEESYLLWPPAILLIILLIAIALVGDALRDTLDPKMQK